MHVHTYVHANNVPSMACIDFWVIQMGSGWKHSMVVLVQ